MKVRSELTTVTGFSKLLALLLFSLLPFMGFYLGMNYQKSLTSPTIPDNTTRWKTYTDSFFSFEYPSDWERKNTTLIPPISPDCLPPHACGGSESNVFIQKHTNPQNTQLLSFIYQTIDHESNGNIDTDQVIKTGYRKNSLLSDSTIESYINTSIPSAGSATRVWYAKNRNILSLSFESINSEIIDHMLKTVRIID